MRTDRHHIITFFLLFVFSICSAVADANFDKLLKNLNSAANATEKFEANKKLGAYYYGRDWRVAQAYYWKALSIAHEIGSKDKIMNCVFNISTLYSVGGNPKIALDSLQVAINLAKDLNDKASMAFGYSQIGTVYYRIGDREKSFEANNKAINLFPINVIDDSLKKYRKLDTLSKDQYDFLNIMSIIYNDLGLLHSGMGNKKEALEVLNVALRLAEVGNKPERIGATTSNIGEIYLSTNHFKKAEECFLKSIEIFKKCGNIRYRLTTINFLVNFYLKSDEIKKAKKTIEDILNEFENNEAEFAGFDIGEIALSAALVYSRSHEVAKALSFIKKAENRTNASQKYKMLLYNVKSKVYANIGDYKNAYKSARQFIEFKNELYDINQYEKIVRQVSFYQIAKKENELQIAKKVIELNKSEEQQHVSQIVLLIVVVGVLILAIFLLVIWTRFKEQNKSKMQEKNLELENTNQKLQEVNNTKDKFFSIIAHDLKNPVGSFKTVVELLHDDYEAFEEEERKEYLGMLKKSSAQIFELLENLLEWSRSQRGTIKFNPSNIDLNMIAQLCTDLTRLTADNKGIQLKNSIPKETFISADAKLITTIIRNLVSNSVKFTKSGGEIEIGILDKTAEEIQLFVRDTGIGMPKDKVEKLFQIDKSVTTPGTDGEAGTGLGLILCKEFVEMHGGTIRVESEVGVGTKFVFTLPIIKENTEESDE